MAELKMLKIIQSNESPPYPVAAKPPPKKIKIAQVQLNTSFTNQYYFPLAAGMLRAYAKKHLKYADYYEFSEMIYKFPENRREIDEICERLSDCDLVGFSSYAWNEQHTLSLAHGYKKRNPNGVVVFGGPQVPDSQKQFRRKRTAELTEEEQKRRRILFTPDFHRLNSFIDICIHGEGERAFKHILEQMAIDGCGDKRFLPSASYVDTNGNFHYNARIERMNDLELAKAPSPFTSGVFDRLMIQNPHQDWIMIYETDRGCPYQCSYCDWGGVIEDRTSKLSLNQIYADIMWAAERRIPYVFLCNANFGILQRDIQIAEFFAEAKARFGYPEAINTQNTKNPKKHTIQALKVLQKAGLNKAAIMSQQSLNPKTLKAVRRENMKMEEYLEMQNLAAKEGIDTMTDLILSMPEETYESIVSGVSTLIKNGQHNRIQTNNLSILRNAEMGDPEYQEKYGFELVKSKIINLHGKVSSETGIEETQELVVGTNTMPGPMWLKARIFCWGADLFYFNKLLQIPIIVLHQEYGLDYGEAIKLLCDDFDEYGVFPVLTELKDMLTKAAQNMRSGGEEFIFSSEWLGVYWPPGEYGFIKLCKENKLESFYEEAEKVLAQHLSRKGICVSADLLKEATVLNRILLKLPFQTENVELNLTYNIWDVYKAVRTGEKNPLVKGCYRYKIDRITKTWLSWEEWYEKVIWWENRRGAYFYESEKLDA